MATTAQARPWSPKPFAAAPQAEPDGDLEPEWDAYDAAAYWAETDCAMAETNPVHPSEVVAWAGRSVEVLTR